MKSNKEGSGLLIIIILMSGLVLYLTSIWQATVYLSDISLLREQYEKEYGATLGLMNWAIALTKINFEALTKEQTTKIAFKWPPTDKQYDAALEITTIDPNNITLCARIANDQRTNCLLKATVLRKIIEEEGEPTHYQFVLRDWQHETT